MNITSIKLEEELVSLYSVQENEVGLGKIIYNEDRNESLISNGKTLISFANTELEEIISVKSNERTLITNLTNNLIHSNYGEMIACELYFSKSDIANILIHMSKCRAEKLTLTFNNKSNAVLASTENNPILVNILEPQQINKFKSADMVATVELNQLYKTVQLLYNQMSDESVFGIALQYHNRPILMATENISACITCVK